MKAEAFLKRFGIVQKHPLKRLHHGVYAIPENVDKTMETIKRDAFSAGLYIGEERDEFRSSPGILELIKDTKQTITINQEASWLFTCGRDIFLTNIIGPCPEGLVLVKNEAGDMLGIGEKHGNILRDVMDVGSFLRREKTT